MAANPPTLVIERSDKQVVYCQVLAGRTLKMAVLAGISLARKYGKEVQFTFANPFKAITVRVTKESELESLLAAFEAPSEDDIIGP